MQDGHDNNWLLLEFILALPFAVGFKTEVVSRLLALTLALEAWTCWPFWSSTWPTWCATPPGLPVFLRSASPARGAAWGLGAGVGAQGNGRNGNRGRRELACSCARGG